MFGGYRPSRRRGDAALYTAPAASVTSAPTGSPVPSAPLSRDAAVALARAAAPQSAQHPVTVAEAGPARDFASAGMEGVPGDRWVWYIVLSNLGPLSGEGTFVILDYVDGTIYEVVDVIG